MRCSRATITGENEGYTKATHDDNYRTSTHDNAHYYRVRFISP